MMRGLFVASLLAVLTGCQSAAPAAKPSPIAVASPGIALNAVRAGLYVSGQPAASDWTAIAAKNIGTVINLRPVDEMAGRDEAAEVASAGMHYVTIPVANAAAITPDAARKLEQALHDANGAVLLHCASGNRAGGLLAVTLAQQEGMSAEQAAEVGRRAGMKSTEARVRQLIGLPADASSKAPATK